MANGQSCSSTLKGPTGHCHLGLATSAWLGHLTMAAPSWAWQRGIWLVLECSGPVATLGAGVASVVRAGGKGSWPGEGAELLLGSRRERSSDIAVLGQRARVRRARGIWLELRAKRILQPQQQKRSLSPYFGLTEEAQLKETLKNIKGRGKKENIVPCHFLFFPPFPPCLL